MKNTWLALSLIVVTLISGCTASATVKSSQSRQGEIIQPGKLLIATNLGHDLGNETFLYLSESLPQNLRVLGVESTVISLAPPDALEQTDIKNEAIKYGSPYVLTLIRGSGVITQGKRLQIVEVICSLTQVSNGRKLWGSTIQFDRGPMSVRMTLPVPFTTDLLIKEIVTELKKIGVVGDPSRVTSSTVTPSISQSPKIEESVESRLRKVDLLLEAKVITKEEHSAKRKEIIGDL